MRARLTALTLAGLSLLVGCGGPSGNSPSGVGSTPRTGGPSPPEPSVPPSAAGTPATGSIFVVAMENKSLDQALSAPYTASLAARALVATNYHAVSRPSLPNYLALTSGSTWDIRADLYRSLPGPDLGAQLTAAQLPWRAYMEDMGTDCRRNAAGYAVKHDPFAYFGDSCPANVVPLSELDTDLQGQTPLRFVWITPNLCHAGHDCGLAAGDTWLATIVPPVTASAAWRANGLLAIVWDEGTATDNHTALLLLRPGGAPGSTDVFYTHYSLLATIESRLGLGRLGEAASAPLIPQALG